jgi:6-phosphogluconate dehydrogenase
MSTHTRTLSESQGEADAVECLGLVLSRYFDALSDMRVSAMIRATRDYSGAFGYSDAFSELDRMAPRYGIVWRLTNDGMFVVDF